MLIIILIYSNKSFGFCLITRGKSLMAFDEPAHCRHFYTRLISVHPYISWEIIAD